MLLVRLGRHRYPEGFPRGSTKHVKDEVVRRIRDLVPGGGYVLAQVHNIQPEVPMDNIVTIYEAAKKYGTYPIQIG